MVGDVPVCPRDHAGSCAVRGGVLDAESRSCSLAHLCWPDSLALLYPQTDSPGRWRKDWVPNFAIASVSPWSRPGHTVRRWSTQ